MLHFRFVHGATIDLQVGNPEFADQPAHFLKTGKDLRILRQLVMPVSFVIMVNSLCLDVSAISTATAGGQTGNLIGCQTAA